MEQSEIIRLLGDNEVFGVLDEHTRALIGRNLELATYRKGNTVFREGEPGDQLFIVATGGVRLLTSSQSGDVLEVRRVFPPALFGELSLLDGGPRSASAETTAKTTLLSLQREIFIALLEREPLIIGPVFATLGRMVRVTTNRAAELVFLDLRARVALRLVELSSETLDGRLVRLRKVTQTELAQMVGGARQTVNAALQSLQDDGYITLDVEGINVVSPEGLAALAAGD